MPERLRLREEPFLGPQAQFMVRKWYTMPWNGIKIQTARTSRRGFEVKQVLAPLYVTEKKMPPGSASQEACAIANLEIPYLCIYTGYLYRFSLLGNRLRGSVRSRSDGASSAVPGEVVPTLPQPWFEGQPAGANAGSARLNGDRVWPQPE